MPSDQRSHSYFLPEEGGKIGFLGNPAQRPEGANDNTGNFLHGFAARYIVGQYRNLYVEWITDESVERYRSELTHVAFVAANDIRIGKDTSQTPGHERLANIFEKLNLPVVVFGLGSQAAIGQKISDAEIPAATLRFLSVISHHTSKIAVRGEFTADLCRHFGIHNVEVIGCQSCFLSRDPGFRLPDISSDPQIERTIVNFTYPGPELPLMRKAMEGNATFIGQSERFEYALSRIDADVTLDDLPEDILALLKPGLRNAFSQQKIDFKDFHKWVKKKFHQFYSMPPWFEKLRSGYDASIGTRFHGNMAAMLAGVPALWIVHDSRTKEFCDHLGLPQAPLQAVKDGLSIAEMFDRYYETGSFAQKYPRNYARFYDYLTEHGVPHKLAAPMTS